MSNHNYDTPGYKGNAFGVHKVEEEKKGCGGNCKCNAGDGMELIGKIVADKINPSHYKQGDIECIDAIKASMTQAEFKGYLKGSILKYLWRYERKNGAEDLEKANWFLDRLRKELGSD